MPRTNLRDRVPELIFWLLIGGALLSYSGIYSSRAPSGNWPNKVFGARMWSENDPAGYYMASAHELFSSEGGSLYPGHPGTTLNLLLWGLQTAYYWLAADPAAGFTFSEFIVRRVPNVYFLAKLMMTVLHLISFFVVHRFSRHFLRGERAAALATLGYATSFPVLYYISRVSVEPLMVIFFLTTILSIWRCQSVLARQDQRYAMVFAAFAGSLAASGFMTKMSILGPLPLFGFVYLIAPSWSESSGTKTPLTRRASASAVFSVSLFVTLVLYASLTDWEHFFVLWKNVAKMRNVQHTSLLPGATTSGVFTLSEVCFLGMGIAGWVLFVRREARARTTVLWVSLYVGFSVVVWGYRVICRGLDFRGFHYLFLLVVFLCVFFGYLSDILLRKIHPGPSGTPSWAVVLLWIFLFHHVAFWAALDSREQDIRSYEPLADVHQLVSSLGKDQTVGILDAPGFKRMTTRLSGARIHGFPHNLYVPQGRESVLVKKYTQLFHKVQAAQVPSDARTGTLPKIGTYVVIDGAPR